MDSPRTATAGRVTLALPAGWDEEDAPIPGLVIAETEDADPVFRMNVVVQESAWPGSLAALVMRSIAQSRELTPGVWTVSVRRSAVAGIPARIVRQAFAVEDTPLVTERFLAVADGRALDLTLTAHAWRSPDIDGWLDDLAQFVTWDRSAEELGETELPPQLVAEPPRDPLASAALEDDLESLAVVREWEPQRAPGVAISQAALAALDAGGPIPEAHRAELQELWLCEDDGTLTVGGQLLATGEDHRRITGDLTTSRGHSTLDVDMTSERARIATGPSLRELRAGAPEDDRLRVTVCDPWMVPHVIAEWVGLAPVWPVDPGIHTLTTDEVIARLDDGERTAPPPGLDDTGRAAWTAPWALWTVTFSSAPDESIAAISVDGVSLNEVVATPDGRLGVAREPLRPDHAWNRLVDGIGGSLSG